MGSKPIRSKVTIYHKSSNKPPRRLIYFRPIWRWGSLFEKGGGGLFNLEKTIVSVLHKELEYKEEKLEYNKVGGHAAEDQNQIRTFRW